MKTIKLLLPLYLLLSVWTLQAHAESPVWKIENGENKVYLGGTVHLLSKADYPLPIAFETAYSLSSRIVFEADLQKMQSPEFSQTLIRKLTYADDRNLSHELSADTYQAVEEFFTTRGISMADMAKFKPGMVAMMMGIIELQRLGFASDLGVDFYFTSKAIQDRKKLGELESVESQLEFIANMGAGQEDAMMRYNLAEIESLPVLWRLIMDAWRSGDMVKLDEVGIVPLKSEFPKVHHMLLTIRNNAWIPQIEAMLKTAEVEFVLVGALHLAGEDGLLEQLAVRNYKITQLH